MNQAPIQRSAMSLIVLLVLTAGLLASVATEPARGEEPIEKPAAHDTLRTHNVFQSNMVLQRDKPIAVWGWAAPGATVTLSFGGKQADATAAADGSWKAKLPAMPASAEPRTMTIHSGDTTLTYTNILVGDIWVLGGQSNMEMPLSRIENGSLEIASANFPNIRIASVPQRSGPEPATDWPALSDTDKAAQQGDPRGLWQECSPQTVPELSAIGYVFVRRIYMATQVPIGVIDASRWGTTVEAWTPRVVLRNMEAPEVRQIMAEWDAKVAAYTPEKALADRIKFYNDRTERMRKEGRDVSGRKPPTEPDPSPVRDFNYPGNCYAGMIAPLEGLAVKGAIFHQGFNNCGHGTAGSIMYRHVFPEMITAWRKAFNDPDMPFCILSLCTDSQPQTREYFTEAMANLGQFIREAQYNTFLHFYKAGDKNVGFVSTYDLRRAWYHPWLKIPAGERAARWALATQYDKSGLRWKPPMLVEMKVESGRLVLRFDDAVAAVGTGLPMEGFAIAGADRKFQPADASHLVIGKDDRGKDQTDPKIVVLTSPMVLNPVAFRYAWARNPMGNMQAAGNTDIPLATQRSDDWPIEQTPLGVFGQDSPTQMTGSQWQAMRQALHEIDMQRRIAEAKTLIDSRQATGGESPNHGSR